MRSAEPVGPTDDLDTDVEARTGRGTLYRLLDPAFGLFVWAIHFVAIYAATAVGCQLGLLDAGAQAQATMTWSMVGLTVLSAAIVVGHAIRKYWKHEQVLDQHFLMWITIGHDAIAALAILWQLFPLLLVDLCV